jgi:hypothetical protein
MIILSSFTALSLLLIFADLVLSIPASRFVRRDSIEGQLVVKAAGRCSLLDEDDVRGLPGWPKLEQHVLDTWGKGIYTLKINPPNYKDKRATMCVVAPVPVIPSSDRNCTSKRVVVPPEKNSKIIDVEYGYKNIGQWNITNVSSAAHAEIFRAHFRIPDIKPLHLGSIDGLADFVNAPHNAFETTASNMTTKQTAITSVHGQSCFGTILNQVCRIPAHGRIQLAATGNLWFTFDTARAPVRDPDGCKHRRYTMKIEDVLDLSDRSMWIDYEGVMIATARTDYFSECHPKSL